MNIKSEKKVLKQKCDEELELFNEKKEQIQKIEQYIQEEDDKKRALERENRKSKSKLSYLHSENEQFENKIKELKQ